MSHCLFTVSFAARCLQPSIVLPLLLLLLYVLHVGVAAPLLLEEVAPQLPAPAGGALPTDG